MFKACFDCLAGEQRPSDQYGVQLNGGSNAPPWPTSSAANGKMFAIPTLLQENDEIIIKGFMTNGLLDIALRPNASENNIVCGLNVVFSEDQTHDQIAIRNVVNGTNYLKNEFRARDYFADPSFDVNFTILSDSIRLGIGENFLDVPSLQHSLDDIRYVSINGDVKELSFKFNA